MGDARLLERAIALALTNVDAGGGPFGAVIAADGRIVAEGVNRVTADLDPTAHAEVKAIRAACTALGRFSLEGLTLFTSCEPCPMCLAAAYWARLDRIVYAADRHDAAAAGFDDAALYGEIARPAGERRQRIIQVALKSAPTPFDAWRARSGRTPY